MVVESVGWVLEELEVDAWRGEGESVEGDGWVGEGDAC